MGKHSAAAEEEEEGGRRRRGASEDGNNTNNNNNLECLYSGDRTKPIKTMKDKFELLPAFLKVRGLGASLNIRLRFSSSWVVSLSIRGTKNTDITNTNLFTTLWNYYYYYINNSSATHRIVRLLNRRGDQEDCLRQGEQQSHVRLGPELLLEV